MYAQNPSHVAASETAIQVPLDKCSLSHKKSWTTLISRDNILILLHSSF